MKFSIGSLEKPLQDVVLNRDDLLRHAAELARFHAQAGIGKEKRYLLPRVADNMRFLNWAHVQVTQYVKRTRDMVPAAEWFLDNYYLIKDLRQQIESNLPRRYEKQLPRVAGGQQQGYPRIFALMVELIEHTDSNLHGEILKDFVNAYQLEAPLSSGELWAIPIMLRIALLENIRRLVDIIVFTQNEREASEKWIAPFLHAEPDQAEFAKLLEAAERQELYSSAYAERLLRRFRDLGPEGAPVLSWFDRVLAKQHTTAEALAKLEHQRQATSQVSMGHAITSVRFLVEEDWPHFFEEISPVERALQADPGGTYGQMDFDSRDKYRHQVEKTARKFGVSELAVVSKVLEWAKQNSGSEGLPQSHVGYYLLGPGCCQLEQDLEREWGALKHFWGRIRSAVRGNPPLVYFGGILLIMLILLYLSLSYGLYNHSLSPGLGLLLLAVLVIPLSTLAISLVNFAVTKLLPPTFFPKLELREGIPEELRTVAVIPTFLNSVSRVKDLLAQMEVYYLGNQDPNLHFALLGDFVDADSESKSGDEEILNAAVEGIEGLNNKYSSGRFFLFNRKRQWNPAEGLWMGWERKRGKLIEFNRLLLGEGPNSYETKVGDLSYLNKVRYVITLDADTTLPRGSAKKLIGTMAHPLHSPRLSSDNLRVVEGYGILQPRIGVSILSAGASFFARTFSGKVGIDPYTSAISDVYQDLFGEGSFTGKGIYDLAVFHRVTGDAFPENTILSHDLLEGVFARTGLVTDVELIDGFPAKYHAYVRRLHRWVRGDWQVLPWLRGKLPAVSRWKIFDNLRRSLEGPSQTALILLAFSVFPGQPWIWAGIVLLSLFLPVVIGCVHYIFDRSGKTCSKDLTDGLIQALLSLTFVPYVALVQLDAIARSLYRQYVSHSGMLEWETAADTEKRVDTSLKTSFLLMYPAVSVVLVYTVWLLLLNPLRALQFAPIAVLWLCSPFLAYWISLPERGEQEELSLVEQGELRLWARKIWAFFEDFVAEDDNWLPPDNVQIEPPKGVAHRTSPTNIGLAMLSNLAARDFGYLSLGQMTRRIENTLNTLDQLEQWRGHFYNWYDTQTLKPLQPLYVSTVDSGNLAIYFMTLNAGLMEKMSQPVIDLSMVRGLRDTYELYLAGLEGEQDFAVEQFGEALAEILNSNSLQLDSWRVLLNKWLLPTGKLPQKAKFWGGRLEQMVISFRQELAELYPWVWQKQEGMIKDKPLIELNLGELSTLLKSALEMRELPGKDTVSNALNNITGLISQVQAVQERLKNMAEKMEFTPLYDKNRQLFSIGYRISDQALDKSYYDLLASEARQASFLAIAKGDVPESHWFRMGRNSTRVKGRRSLASWSGTMFEFMMPLLVMRNYPGTLLDQTYRSVVEVQRQYCLKQNIPWGVSESGFYLFDTQRNYQYKAFGVPGLGLKRGLVQDLVITPYATFLALMVEPGLALGNLRHMAEKGFEGSYGLYEAIDYTTERVPVGRGYGVVQSFMAHHQGMSLLALGNVLHDNCMPRRFHSDALIQATELLLQERPSSATKVTAQPEERREISDESREPLQVEGRRFVSYNTAKSLIPVTHFLSNGQYCLMLTNAGSGFSRCGEISLSRWREDVTRDAWGMYFYIQNLNSGTVWSAAHQPWGNSGDDYKVTYAPDRVEFCRRDGNIGTKTEVVVSSEDQVELRRISLTNHSQHDRTLEVTSYFETVLARMNEDLAHPAFSNLFIQTEFTHQALLASRRPRRGGEKQFWLMHSVVVEGETTGALQYETDRSRFIGRGRTLARPQALEPNQPLSNSVGAVLDPIMSLRQRVRVCPGQTVRLSYAVGLGESRDEVIRLAEKYRDPAAVERAFELAWTYSQVELRHLNLAPVQANEALNLGGNLLYLSPCRIDYADVIAQNHKGQSALWPYAISGDLPIVLVRVQENSHLDLVRQILVVHEYWRLKGLTVDLVILNEDESGYIQTFQDSLRDLVSMGHARELMNQPGGIFLLQKDLTLPEDITLLFTVARVIFSGQGGSCTVQMRKKSKQSFVPLKDLNSGTGKYPGKSGSDPEPQRKEAEILLYPNGYGGFSEDGREYVIELKEGKNTPLPWSNVIANPDFGFLITESGGGYTWSKNSRENKLTSWSNDPVGDPCSEALFLRDEANGEFWTTAASPVRGPGRYLVRHGQGYSIFEHSSHGLDQRLQVFVPVDDPVKVINLTLHNYSDRERKLTATYYAELVLGVARENTAPYLVTDFDSELQAVIGRNTFQEEYSGRRGFLCAVGPRVLSYTGDRTEFIGRIGNLRNPAALQREGLTNTVGAGLDSCMALQVEVSLAPGETKTLFFLLGEAGDDGAVEKLVNKYRNPGQLEKAFDEVKGFWDYVLGAIEVHTPDKSMDLLFNRWLLYQTVACRLWARSGFYQSGGAYGFRDQLQDAMAVVTSAPQWTREQIIRHCSHQFVEGDVQHWWHAEANKGIRTRFSDDLIWLPFVTADYIEHTGDYSLLEVQAGFLEEDLLPDGVDERYSVPRRSEEKGSVYEHCVRALEKGMRFGEHGLPLIGSGDWNDGFSSIGSLGRGESVWLGWFLYLTLMRFSSLCEHRQDPDRAERYRSTAALLGENLEKHGWDGGWYRRAYFDDGTPLGSAMNEECQIDCIAQAWAVISGAAKPQRTKDAMLALEHYLLRRDEGILLLLTPPFDRFEPNPGYIRGYIPGVRENGGQYTHGAIWAVLAWAQMGEGNKALEVFQMLNPINHSRTESEVARYKTEPYVMSADVYATSYQVGRGGWSWYTGAAGWMYKTALEGILGFQLKGDKFSVNPCIPGYWPGYSLEYRHKQTLYRINVVNPEGVMSGVGQVILDGQTMEDKSILLQEDGKTHEVKIILSAAASSGAGSMLGEAAISAAHSPVSAGINQGIY